MKLDYSIYIFIESKILLTKRISLKSDWTYLFVCMYRCKRFLPQELSNQRSTQTSSSEYGTYSNDMKNMLVNFEYVETLSYIKSCTMA